MPRSSCFLQIRRFNRACFKDPLAYRVDPLASALLFMVNDVHAPDAHTYPHVCTFLGKVPRQQGHMLSNNRGELGRFETSSINTYGRLVSLAHVTVVALHISTMERSRLTRRKRLCPSIALSRPSSSFHWRGSNLQPTPSCALLAVAN